MPGHVDLGDDRDESIGGVGHEIRVLLLREEPADAAADFPAAAARRQLRPRLDLDAPALVVGEMQMQPIELIECQQIDVPLDVFYPEEMARDVEHRATPREAGTIDDVNC